MPLGRYNLISSFVFICFSENAVAPDMSPYNAVSLSLSVVPVFLATAAPCPETDKKS